MHCSSRVFCTSRAGCVASVCHTWLCMADGLSKHEGGLMESRRKFTPQRSSKSRVRTASAVLLCDDVLVGKETHRCGLCLLGDRGCLTPGSDAARPSRPAALTVLPKGVDCNHQSGCALLGCCCRSTKCRWSVAYYNDVPCFHVPHIR